MSFYSNHVFLFLMLCGVTAATHEIGTTEDHMDKSLVINDLIKIIRSSEGIVSDFEYPSEEDYDECYISEQEPCNFDTFAENKVTLVFPGGNTRCMTQSADAPYGGDFAFEVYPGAKDKVLFNFQDGGACWDPISTKQEACWQHISPQLLKYSYGIFERDNEKNIYKDYLTVNVLYCSGDVHVGYNASNGFETIFGDEAIQNGGINAQVTLDWLHAQLDETPGKLVIAGQSAGALGAQAWVKGVKSTLESISGIETEAVALFDSFLGVLPLYSGPMLLGDVWNACESVVEKYYSQDLLEKCKSNELYPWLLVQEALEANPQTPFGIIQSKSDIFQIAFYMAIKLTLKGFDAEIMTRCKFYELSNMLIVHEYSHYENLFVYMINGDKHMHLINSETSLNGTWVVDAENIEGSGYTPSLMMWLEKMQVRQTSSECSGNNISEDLYHSKCTRRRGPKYCAMELQDKHYEAVDT